MNVSVGSSVTKDLKPPSEHGVVTDAGPQTVTVRWHLKEAEGILADNLEYERFSA
jgi:hypothetical protein